MQSLRKVVAGRPRSGVRADRLRRDCPHHRIRNGLRRSLAEVPGRVVSPARPDGSHHRDHCRYIAFALSIVILALFIAAYTKRRERSRGTRRSAAPRDSSRLSRRDRRPPRRCDGQAGSQPVRDCCTDRDGASRDTGTRTCPRRWAGNRLGLTATTGRTFRANAIRGYARTPHDRIRCAHLASLMQRRAWVSLVPITVYSPPIGIHVTHRVLAFLAFWPPCSGWHRLASRKRKEPFDPPRRADRFRHGGGPGADRWSDDRNAVPPAFRSLHQAFGTLLWLAVVVLAILSSEARIGAPSRLR